MPTPRGIPLAPLTGVLDLRSSPDLMQPSSLRMRQNLQTTAENKLRRGTGFAKFLDNQNYNNEDYHDQLLALTEGGIRQPVTMLFETESSTGARSLIVGKQGAISQLDEFSGNYRVLGSGYGGTLTTSAAGKRFKAAQVGDVLGFTNDWEVPMYTILGQPSIDSEPILKPFDDLAIIGLTRAKVIFAWHNCLFLADVEMDGQRYPFRLVWSDYINPTSFDPAKPESITGTKDLFTDERILAFADFGNSGLLYTTRRIWLVSVVGGEVSFGFSVAYDGRQNQGASLLKYPNTLVSIPGAHWYMAEDGVYSMTPYQKEPTRIEWLHRSTPAIMDDIDKTNCEVHIAHCSGNEVLFSTASTGATNACPDRTLRVNFVYQSCDVVDVGFTAFCNYRSYKVPTIRDFIIANGICDLAGLEALGYGYDDEGLPKPLLSATGAFTPEHLYTDQTQEIDLGDGGDPLVTEDWTQESASSDSLCALLAGQTLDDFCRKCEGETLIVGASSADLSLKQLGREVFLREICVNPTATGSTGDNGYDSAVGSYVSNGLDAILRFAPVFMPREYNGQPLSKIGNFLLDALSKVQNPPSEVGLTIGISAQVLDPNKPADRDRIRWFVHSKKKLKVQSDRTGAQHTQAKTIPSSIIRWPVYREGRVLYLELTIAGIGGDCELSGVTAEVETIAARNW